MKKEYTYFDSETSVRGKLKTNDVIIGGSFKGTIFASGSVMLTKTVRLDATIKTKKLMVEEGASFSGPVTLSIDEE